MNLKVQGVIMEEREDSKTQIDLIYMKLGQSHCQLKQKLQEVEAYKQLILNLEQQLIQITKLIQEKEANNALATIKGVR